MIELIYVENEGIIVEKNVKTELNKLVDKIDLDKESFEYMQYIENQIVDGYSLEELYMYDGVPVYIFYRNSFLLILKNIISHINNIEKLKSIYDTDIHITTDNFMLKQIAESIFNIKTELVPGSKSITSNYDNWKYIFKSINRFIKGGINFFKFKFVHGKENFLILSQAASINTISSAYVDTQFGMTISKLNERYNILNMQLLNNIKKMENASKYNEKYVPFEFFLLYKKLHSKVYFKSKLVQDRLELLKKLDYKYRNYSIKEIVFRSAFDNIKNVYISYVNEMVIAGEMLKKNKIKKCLVIDEGDRARCFISASNKLGIKTYAIQHGIINATSPAYMINSKYGKELIPYKTFLWGNKYRNILEENTKEYNEENTIVVGQARTDFIDYTNKESLTPKNSINILYATQYLKDLLEPATEMLFKALKLSHFNYNIIIKLHPSDNNLEFYKAMIEKYEINNITVEKNGNLYELIAWSDVIVSVHSTVVAEGALFNKPSICILLPKYYDEGEFVKDGLSLGAENENVLVDLLTKIKNKEVSIDTSSYLDNYFYKVDGLVADRIVKNINE